MILHCSVNWTSQMMNKLKVASLIDIASQYECKFISLMGL